MAFYSKKLTPAESRYHVTDRELMAVYLACTKWRPHLNARQACWLEQLAELELTVHYVLGKENDAADVLSHYG